MLQKPDEFGGLLLLVPAMRRAAALHPAQACADTTSVFPVMLLMVHSVPSASGSGVSGLAATVQTMPFTFAEPFSSGVMAASSFIFFPMSLSLLVGIRVRNLRITSGRVKISSASDSTIKISSCHLSGIAVSERKTMRNALQANQMVVSENVRDSITMQTIVTATHIHGV